jgi:hypothetical protein
VDETWPGDGTGLAAAQLADQAGVVGVIVQAQTLMTTA